MKLLENEAKEIFAKYGIETPKRFVIEDKAGLAVAYDSMPAETVLKPMGIKGRGKAGLIEFPNGLKDAEEKLDSLSAKVKHDKEASGFILEEKVDIAKEFYVGVTVDYASGRPVLIMSPEGGISIEDTAKSSPERMRSLHIDITAGLDEPAVRTAIKELGIAESDKFYSVVESVYGAFREYDADTLEINPLALTKDGRLIALDAVLNINDDSLFKHPELEAAYAKRRYKTDFEREMGAQGWSYVDLDGDIGMISSGAGLSMATLDLIKMGGGKPANFLDMAQVNGDGIAKGLEIISKKPGINAIFVNLIAGLNRCDVMAEGVKKFSATGNKIPLVVRMVGNMSEEGTKVLASAGIKNIDSLEDAVDTAIRAAK